MNTKNKLQIYKDMVTIRKFEEECVALSAKGKLPGFLHLYIGEEAIASAVGSVLRKDDYITSTHRGHGHLIAKGGDINLMMAELYGKKTGYCLGKGGSMHIADGDIGILGANGIVGGGFQIAAGAGAGLQYKGTDQVVVCFFGDGATSQGSFHESMNLSSVWDLPVVYICENNQTAISTCNTKQMNVKKVADRAKGYNIPGYTVDGNDVYAVYEAVEKAIERARKGGGPTLLECVTYRWRGHSEGDPCHYYRTDEEVQSWMEKDPIPRFRSVLIEEGVKEETLDAIDVEVEQAIEEAVEFGESSPYPDPSEVTDMVYASKEK